MELKEIQIKNFRSVKDEKIIFHHNCLVLIGKNEAGKTNILKAISSLFETYNISNKDKRKRIDNEKISEYCVRAVFKLSEEDFKTIEEQFKQEYSGYDLIKFKSGITLNEFIRKIFYNINLKIDIGDYNKPYLTYWTYSKNDIELEKPLFISNKSIQESGGAELQLLDLIFQIAKKRYEENPLKCHYWQYSDNYLLPSSVNINDFISSPSKYKALENIFFLSGRENIRKEFEDALSQDGDYSNLLEQVSKKVTQTFQKIWNDFKGTTIQLLPNGDEILIKLAEKAKYNFEDRSDGFKKFISILLMLSTQSRSNKFLENDIILIDEPDQSLYPTSAKYLRDELIEISKKSKVIYSTHSQYMIDSECLERHLVIEKKDDITIISKDNTNAPYTTDELLRRAIGASIFECLKPKNIIFEGYLDKELFKAYCKFNKTEKDFTEYGAVYLNGISGAETLVQILTLAGKKFVIVADSDETSSKKRLDFEKNYPEYKNNWLAYGDICTNISTMEDFIQQEYIIQQIKLAGYSYDYDVTKNANYNIEKAVNKSKDLKQDLKKLLVQNLKKNNIDNNYYDYLESLKEKLASI